VTTFDINERNEVLPVATPVASSSHQDPGGNTPLVQRQRGWGWLGSCVAHSLVCVLAFWGFEKVVDEPPPTVRLVFVQPPPPPPAPLGAPAATGTTPVAEQPPVEIEKPKVEKPVEPLKPKRKEPNRVKVTKKKRKQEPIPEPQPEPVSPSIPETGPETARTETATPQGGIASGAVGGVAGGVVGGVAGGVVGGVIGGTGTGPLPADLAANPPLLISRVVPEYPRLARQQGIEGLVVLEAVLDSDGRIEDNIKVLQSIPMLDEAAIRAIRRWRFRPARDHQNRPLRVILEIPVRFVLR
jgi:protein TonB